VPQELQFENGSQVRTRRADRSVVMSGRVACEDGSPALSGTIGLGEYIYVDSTTQYIPYSAQFLSLSPFVAGRFVFEIAPGPSRVLYVAYTPRNGDYSSISPQQLLLYVAARPKLKASKNRRRVGQKTRFFGRIPNHFINGRPSIALQAKSGRKWRTFKVVPVNANGKFSGVYRFSRTSRPTLYRFRAKIVSGGTDYPYVTRVSKKTKVHVRP
jgi:hypothetical protein